MQWLCSVHEWRAGARRRALNRVTLSPREPSRRAMASYNSIYDPCVYVFISYSKIQSKLRAFKLDFEITQ